MDLLNDTSSFTDYCRNAVDVATLNNSEADFIYYTYLQMLSLNMFKYKGLPESINTFYLEYILQTRGYIGFYKDKNLGLICSEITLGGQLNHYGMPTVYHTVSTSPLLKKTLKNSECVVMKNSPLYVGLFPYLKFYAKKLALTSRTMDQNLSMQWTPYIITGDKRMLSQFMNFMKKIFQGVRTIFVSKGFRLEDVNVLQTNAPFIADELHNMKQSILRECMTFLGIENANMDKKERLVSDEVNANNQQVIASRNIWLNERKKAIEELNKKYGLNASVEFAPYENFEKIMKLLELDSNTSVKDFNINKNLDVEGD